jgi:hypothetical protein
MLVSDRTGAARQATAGQARVPFSGSKMATATNDIISVNGESIHWAG